MGTAAAVAAVVVVAKAAFSAVAAAGDTSAGSGGPGRTSVHQTSSFPQAGGLGCYSRSSRTSSGEQSWPGAVCSIGGQEA